MSRRRLRKDAAHLEITAFINLIVVLVPFLLSTAVFTRLAVLDLALPGPGAALEQLKAENLLLEVVIRKDALEVGDRIGGLIQRIPRSLQGSGKGQDLKALSALLLQVKARYPQQQDATLLAEADTAYDEIVQVMDVLRASVTAQGAKVARVELFPHIAIGDAPARTAKAGA